MTNDAQQKHRTRVVSSPPARRSDVARVSDPQGESEIRATSCEYYAQRIFRHSTFEFRHLFRLIGSWLFRRGGTWLSRLGAPSDYPGTAEDRSGHARERKNRLVGIPLLAAPDPNSHQRGTRLLV